LYFNGFGFFLSESCLDFDRLRKRKFVCSLDVASFSYFMKNY